MSQTMNPYDTNDDMRPTMASHMRQFLQDRFWINWSKKESIENYAKLFGYFRLASIVSVGALSAVMADSYVPLFFSIFIGVMGFVVGDYFSECEKRVYRAQCRDAFKLRCRQ